MPTDVGNRLREEALNMQKSAEAIVPYRGRPVGKGRTSSQHIAPTPFDTMRRSRIPVWNFLWIAGVKPRGYREGLSIVRQG
jgi:hypothetical protein